MPHDLYFSWKIDEMKRLSVGGFATEVVGDDGRCDMLNKYKISWMQFTYNNFSDLTWDNPGLFYSTCEDTNSMSSCLNVDEVKKWARTYAKAVAGRTNYFYFNSSTREAELNYLSDPSVTAPTIIFLSEKWIYTSGFSVSVQPPSLQCYSDYHLVVYHPQNLSLINVTVSISPK